MAEVKIPTFKPTSKASKEPVTNMLYPQIEIMISPSSRPGSAGTRDGLEGTDIESHGVEQSQDKQKIDGGRVDIIDLEETEEEKLKRKEAEDVVRKAIRSAFNRNSVDY